MALPLSEHKVILSDMQTAIDSYRKNVINKAIEEGTLLRYMLPKHQKEIDNALYGLRATIQCEYAVNEEIHLDLFYDINENGIIYE